MARRLPHDRMLRIAAALFQAVGAPVDEADLTAAHLVQSSLMGLDSHGIMRVPEYLELVEQGAILPGAAMRVDRTSPTTAIIDCGHNFGPVGALRAVHSAMDMAVEHSVGCVITRRCNHVGRLGAYVQAAAEHDLLALATCSSPVHGHFVLPWGGTQPRLATNPIAYAVPADGVPIVADFSTSVVPEGKIRLHHNEGKPLPAGWAVDALGQPASDAGQFYGPPRGSLLPLGGPAGHKGFALGLLVDILGNALAGFASNDPAVGGNGLCFIVINPASFITPRRFRRLVAETSAYLKSSPPAQGFSEVLMPGELEFRTRQRRLAEGIPVDDVTWQAISRRAGALNVDVD